MINCSECLPTIEESLNNISKYNEAIVCFFGILVAVIVLYLVIKLLKMVYSENKESEGN